MRVRLLRGMNRPQRRGATRSRTRRRSLPTEIASPTHLNLGSAYLSPTWHTGDAIKAESWANVWLLTGGTDTPSAQEEWAPKDSENGELICPWVSGCLGQGLARVIATAAKATSVTDDV
ncbi:hypothetical protein PG997_015438 [Apiospora hydei]|uniref:Uncharacterized protein n=1 Tax=Apiospora hydei TaxID=1337664 RepID=A0ABR1UQM3_9PEZI